MKQIVALMVYRHVAIIYIMNPNVTVTPDKQLMEIKRMIG